MTRHLFLCLGKFQVASKNTTPPLETMWLQHFLRYTYKRRLIASCWSEFRTYSFNRSHNFTWPKKQLSGRIHWPVATGSLEIVCEKYFLGPIVLHPGLFSLGNARSVFRLTSKIPPLGFEAKFWRWRQRNARASLNVKNPFPWHFQIRTISGILLFGLVQYTSAVCTNHGQCRNEYTSARWFCRTYWNLADIPRDIPVRAQLVDLRGNGITTLPARVFESLVDLREIQLFDNRISHIEPGAFRGLLNLNLIGLSTNRLSGVRKEVFASLYNLQSLKLSWNNINKIEEGAFDSLFSLTSLDIRQNRLRTLSPDLFINTPRPIVQLLMSDANDTNQWDCSSLCWMKHDEQHGTVNFRWLRFSPPKCSGDNDWASLQCGHPGESDTDWIWVRQLIPGWMDLPNL